MHFLLQRRPIRHQRRHTPAQQIAKVAQAGRIDVQDRHFGADSGGDPRRVGARDSAAQHRHAARSHARGSAQQHAASAVLRLHAPSADLHREPPGHFAHRREQRQALVLELHRLVAERGRAAAHEFARERRFGGQMEIGEEHQIAAQEAEFGALRLLDLEHHPRAFPYRGGRSHDLRAGGAILAVAEAAAGAGAALHQHAMVVAAKGGGAGRRQRDAPLVRLYLGGYSDDHVRTNPFSRALAGGSRAIFRRERACGT